MLNKIFAVSISALIFLLVGCEKSVYTPTNDIVINTSDETFISLSENEITVDGQIISADTDESVYIANDIIYYESGKDSTYGDGNENDAHQSSEAFAHSVIHITRPGVYRLSGTLSQGQIFVDLGDGAKEDENAKVTLVLDNVDISCTVAPAILFYNVYECGNKNDELASHTVDTSNAGANVIIADDSVNNIIGAYVAKIYSPGTTDKLHKYDGAFYSKHSMNIDGETSGNGILNITAENEGLNSELHLTINGGNITISAQNDGINTNEDNISVTTVNGGSLTINAGLGEEGDGIDSNGYIVVNGGYIFASACDRTPDGGLDSDLGILLNGGTVVACGNQNGAISPESTQQFMALMLTKSLAANSTVCMLDKNQEILRFGTFKSCSSLLLSSPEIKGGKAYSITENGKEVTYSYSSGFTPGMFDGKNMPPMGGQRPEGGGKFNKIPKAPENIDEWLNSTDVPEDIREWILAMKDFSDGFNMSEFNPDTMKPVPNA